MSAGGMGVRVNEYDSGSGLPRQSGTLSYQQVVETMSDPQNRSLEFADGGVVQDGPGAYQLTARNLAYPGQLVMAPVPTLKDKFHEWWLNFQYDVFQDVPDSFVYPTLRQADTFYTVRFEDGGGRAYEVGVCPVFDQEFTGHHTNLIKVHVRPPERPATHDEKLRSPYYAVDQVNVELMKMLFPEYVLQSPTASSLLSARRQLARKPGAVEDAIDVPGEVQFVFRSRFGEERECGTNSIPQVMGRLWFLRDALAGPVQYTLVEMNQAAYVGLLQNVAGFNVYFQVNCSMPMTRLEGYFPSCIPHCPLLSRSRNRVSSAALGVGVVSAPMGAVAGTLPVLTAASGTVEKLVSMMEHQFRTEVSKASSERQDLYKRVLTHAAGRADAYSRMVRHRREQQYVESIQLVFGSVLGELLAPASGVGANASPLRKAQLLDAVFEGKFLGMLSVLEALPPDAVVAAANAVDKYDAVVGDVDWDNVVRVLKTAPPARVRYNVVATFVPAVVGTAEQLLSVLSAFPEKMPAEALEKHFGLDINTAEDKIVDKRGAWWARNTQPTVDVLDKTKRDITMPQFALWYTAQLFSQGAAGPGITAPAWRDAFNTRSPRIAGL